MRIAIFTEVLLPKIDGITNRLRCTLRCFRELGHEVVVFAPETEELLDAYCRAIVIHSQLGLLGRIRRALVG